MTKTKIVLYSGALWEAGRFFYLFLIISLLLNPAGNPVLNVLLLWLSAGQACGAVLFFLIGYLPGKFSSLRGLLILYKFIGIIPALVYSLGLVILPRTMTSGSRSSLGLSVPLAVSAVDLLFLTFLLLWKPGGGPRDADNPDRER
jgi:hypothetical protein